MKILISIFSVTIVILTSIVTNLADNQSCDIDGCSNIGKAVQIVSFTEGVPKYHHQSLLEVFQHEKAKGKPVIIISMAGGQGVGKSFLLNLCLRYLNYIQYNDDKSLPVSVEQLMENNEKLNGFEWGSKVDEGGTTMGILIWSQPFILNLEDNTKVAVFLMDTQGSHDSNSNTMNSAIVYGLSTFISSIQVYNIVKKPNSNDYKHLVQFSNHGAKAAPQQGNLVKLFQKLIFVVRDWSDISSYPYGVSGGERYKNEVLLAVNDKNTKEVKNNKRRINECYANIDCFLMPYPGSEISGAHNSINLSAHLFPKEFSQELLNFMKWIFGTENINSENIKKVNGLPIITDYVPFYFGIYFDTLLNISSSFESIDESNTADIIASNNAALQNAMSVYSLGMKNELDSATKWDDSILKKCHDKLYGDAIESFRKTNKLGGDATHATYEKSLSELMNLYFENAKGKTIKEAKYELFAISAVTAVTVVAVVTRSYQVGFATALSEVKQIFESIYANYQKINGF